MKMKLFFITISIAAAAQLTAAGFYIGQKVKIKIEKTWYAATVVKVKAGSCYVSYDGYGSDSNQWVDNSYIHPKNTRGKNKIHTTQLTTSARFKQIEKKYGIAIKWKINAAFLPKYWKTKPINGNAVALDQQELKRFPVLIEKSLSRYPHSVIKKNLKGIYLAKELQFYGVGYGGTYYYDQVYITSQGVANNYNDEFIIKSFHHEFSSILMTNYNFPKAAWAACNKRGYKYGKGGMNAIKSGTASLSGSPRTYKNGFISQYSMSAIEEDFNVFSETMFIEPAKMQRLIKQYPIIAKKARVWLRFYKKIHPTFTKSYFFSR